MSKRSKVPPGRADFPDETRHVPTATRLALVAAAAGRCQFNGCNRFLFAHDVTKQTGYFGNYAHIRAFSPDGPRADGGHDASIHELDNLMLLCPICHKLVDTEKEQFPVDLLRAWKRRHESHVAFLLGLPTANEAAMLEIWTDVSHPPVARSHGKLVAALLPLYPSQRHSYLIDFAGRSLADATLIGAATEQIDRELGRLFAANGERPAHLAVFGITNIPLLVYLGSKIGDRIETHLFQHHRDTSDWRWKDEAPAAAFEYSKLRTGRDPAKVALVLSISGAIDLPELPELIDETYSVYEVRLASANPNPGCLRAREDFAQFRQVYRALLAHLRAAHGAAAQIALFPAVPIPVAISLGMDRLPKVDPPLAVYDFDRGRLSGPGWQHVLDVR